MIDKSTGIPAYKQIGVSIRTDISRGVYPVGSKLPNEDEIAKKHGVSRGTVRQALGDLCNQGIIKKAHGLGTFVCDSGNEFVIETDHFISVLDSLENAGTAIDTTIINRGLTIPQGKLRDVFKGDLNLFELKRLLKKDGKPIMFSIDHIPCDLAPNIENKLKDEKSIYEFIEKTYAVRISKVKRVFYAIGASGEVAKALSIKEGEPIFFVTQQAFEEYGRCIDYAYLYIISDAMHFSVLSTR